MENSINRRSLLAATLAASASLSPNRALAAPASSSTLPAFRQGGRSFVFLSPLRTAPDVTLPMTDGRVARLLDSGQRRPTIVYFGATWCPPCRVELAGIEARLQQPGPHPRVVTIMTDAGGAGIVTPFLRRHGLRRPVALDPDNAVARRPETSRRGDPFVLWSLPLSYVLGPEGQVIGYLPGAIDWTMAGAAEFFRALNASN